VAQRAFKAKREDSLFFRRRAAAEAIKRTKAAGGTITYQSGKKIIKEYADGHKEVLQVLDKAYVKPIQKVYKLTEIDDFPVDIDADDNQTKRRSGLGCMMGKIEMADDFDESLEDFKDYM